MRASASSGTDLALRTRLERVGGGRPDARFARRLRESRSWIRCSPIEVPGWDTSRTWIRSSPPCLTRFTLEVIGRTAFGTRDLVATGWGLSSRAGTGCLRSRRCVTRRVGTDDALARRTLSAWYPEQSAVAQNPSWEGNRHGTGELSAGRTTLSRRATALLRVAVKLAPNYPASSELDGGLVDRDGAGTSRPD
jgi:hypothetical protein